MTSASISATALENVFVIQLGADCDGYSKAVCTRYANQEIASKMAASSNEASDGIRHYAVSESDAVAYCHEHEIAMPDYYFDESGNIKNLP